MTQFIKKNKTYSKTVLFITCLFLLHIASIKSQNSAPTSDEHTGILTVGTSIGLVMINPTINGAFDYKLKNWISVGIAANYLQMKGNEYYANGSLARTNVAARALVYLGHYEHVKLYAGIRLGASFWDGTGEFNYNNLAKFKGGDVLPSAQALLGFRWMISHRIGLNAEAGLGSPYAVSLGLNYAFGKINNENKTSFEKIQDAYHSEILPPRKKNILKLNVGSLAGVPGISFERHLFNRFSAEIGGSANFYNSPGFASTSAYSSEVGKVSESDSLSKGEKLFGQMRFYFKAKKFTFPKGLYFAAQFGYSNQTTLVHVEDLDSVKQSFSFDYEKQIVQYTGALLVGYQQPIGKHITIDATGGLKFGSSSLKKFHYLDSQASEQKFNAAFGNHLNPINQGVNPFVLRLSVGYAF